MDRHDSAYITQAPPQKNSHLRAYVSTLNSKIDYAKWKQDLVLSYNYMPLANIKQKLQIDYALYLKKMQNEESKLRATIQNQEIITLLTNLSSYKVKLLENAEKTQIKIQMQRSLVKKLRQQANSKKQMLKSIMRNTKQKIRQDWQSNGIQSARDLKSIKRSMSTLSKLDTLTSRNPRSSIPDLIRTTKDSHLVSLYNNCLQALPANDSKNSKDLTKNKKQTRKQSNQFLINNVPNKNQILMKWDQFKRLSFNELVQMISKKDPSRQVLKKIIYH